MDEMASDISDLDEMTTWADNEEANMTDAMDYQIFGG